MKSKTTIEKQLHRKTNSELVETVISAKKSKAWLKVASLIAAPRKNHSNINLSKLNSEVKEGDAIVVIGKILSQGEMDKKINIAALGFSKIAKEKLLKSGSKVSSILEEIKSNPEAKGIKIIK
jgi:large subunit ribosomal protein L18e